MTRFSSCGNKVVSLIQYQRISSYLHLVHSHRHCHSQSHSYPRFLHLGLLLIPPCGHHFPSVAVAAAAAAAAAAASS